MNFSRHQIGSKTVNLNEAIKSGKVEQFAEEHEVKDARPDGPQRFSYVLGRMSGKTKEEASSSTAFSEGYSETQTRRDT